MPVSWNLPMVRLSCAICRSPCSTWISTVVWLSSAVEKTSDFLVGIVVFRGMSTVVTPPSVSMPSDSGVTSSSRTSFTSPPSTPPWIAAPIATTSSGFTERFGSLPKNSLTISWIFGMRVEPPTRMTSSISVGLEAGILERLLHRRNDALDQVVHQLLELGPGERQVEVLRARLVGRDERQVDVGLRGAGQLHLRLFRGFLEALQRHRVLGEVDALVALELGDQPLDQPLVEIVAAEVGVAVGALHLEDALGQLEHRDVVGAAAEVEDGDLLVLLLVETVGECRGRRLVDDAQHLEARRSCRRPWWPAAARR